MCICTDSSAALATWQLSRFIRSHPLPLQKNKRRRLELQSTIHLPIPNSLQPIFHKFLCWLATPEHDWRLRMYELTTHTDAPE